MRLQSDYNFSGFIQVDPTGLVGVNEAGNKSDSSCHPQITVPSMGLLFEALIDECYGHCYLAPMAPDVQAPDLHLKGKFYCHLAIGSQKETVKTTLQSKRTSR